MVYYRQYTTQKEHAMQTENVDTQLMPLQEEASPVSVEETATPEETLPVAEALSPEETVSPTESPGPL